MTGDDVIFSDLDRDAEDAIEAMNETAQEEFEQRKDSIASAADILSEYKRFQKLAQWHASRERPYEAGRCIDELPELAERLDNCCDDLGIILDVEGFPAFTNIGYGIGHGQPYYTSNREYAKLSDLRAMLEWIESTQQK